MAHALLTVDIWDTILRRRCHPDEVKLFVARAFLLAHADRIQPHLRTPVALLHLRQYCEHAIGQESVAMGLDDEYRLDDVLVRSVSLAIPSISPVEAHAIASWLREVELAQEHRITEADPHAATVLAAAGGQCKVGLSDFYLDSADLSALIAAKAPHIKLDDVVTSAQVGLNKRSGRLFRYILDREGLTPSQASHVGDNEHADVAVPASMGIHTVHFLPPHETAVRAGHRRRWDARSTPGSLTHALRGEIARAVRAPRGLTAEQEEIFYFGARCAPLYAGLVLRAIEEAVARRVPAVHYFTREGVFFRKVHEAIADASPGRSLLGVPLPHAELLEVSRLATFCASLREVSTREFMRLWNLYSTQSIEGLLASLDIPEIAVRPVLKFHGIDPTEQIQYPWLDARVQALIADRRFSGTILRARTQRRDVLHRYLAARGFVDDGSPKVIVDIGWRGTIQDNLAHACPNSLISGVYLGMHTVLNEQPRNVAKLAYACDAANDAVHAGLLLEHVQPLEVLANSPDGSVRGYKPTETGIEVECAYDPGETAMWQHAVQYFQRGVLAAVPTITRWIRDYAFSAADLQPMAAAAVRDIMAMPPLGLCRAFYRLRHNETFGLGGFVDMQTPDPTYLARIAHTSVDANRDFWSLVMKAKWPAAYLRLYGLENERRQLARMRYWHVPLVDPQASDPAHAAWSLAQIQSARTYRLLTRLKKSLPVRIVTRLRYGAKRPEPAPNDPVAQLSAVARGRAFQVAHWLRHTSLAEKRAIRRLGLEALDRW
ncbi:MAG TPA: hypothetical protein VK176_01350 [Phycisphaerales bacterium]|nr:hypothetical protein [Phycisphaerales bacterium]